MKSIAILILASLPVPQITRPVTLPEPHFSQQQTAKAASRKGGKWYFAATGHAVYCYGPVMYVTEPQGSLKRVATFCQNDQPMVPLKD